MSRARRSKVSTGFKKAGKGMFFFGLGEATFGAVTGNPLLTAGGLATSIMGGIGSATLRPEYVKKRTTLRKEARYMAQGSKYVQKKYPKDISKQAKTFGKRYKYMLETTKR